MGPENYCTVFVHKECIVIPTGIYSCYFSVFLTSVICFCDSLSVNQWQDSFFKKILIWLHWVFSCSLPDLWSSLQHKGSFIAMHERPSICGMGAPELKISVVVVHTLNFPKASGILLAWPGIRTVSPELEGRFLTTRPLGKSLEPFSW